MVHPKYIDIAERVLLTWFATFLTSYAPEVLGSNTLAGLVNMDLMNKSATAGVSAVIMLVANLFGLKVGNGQPPFFLAPNSSTTEGK